MNYTIVQEHNVLKVVETLKMVGLLDHNFNTTEFTTGMFRTLKSKIKQDENECHRTRKLLYTNNDDIFVVVDYFYNAARKEIHISVHRI